MMNFICPICGCELLEEERLYRCANGHCYDKAKNGYINLLPASGRGKRHGDDKLMVRARRDFLSKGYYDLFSNAVSKLADEFCDGDIKLLDSGCGEGKYTEDVRSYLAAHGKTADIIGIDISKDAVAYAAKHCKNGRFAVASCGAVPLTEDSVDLILNIFSPFTATEYCRVLKTGGLLIHAYPLEEHLFELKELVYDTPYLNPPEVLNAGGFEVVKETDCRYEIELSSNEDIKNLFMMTPYYYKTGRENQAKLNTAESLTTRLVFGLKIYKKIK